MNGLLMVWVSLSVSASLIALLLFLLRPLYRNRFSKAWQYYIWLVVVLRLLIPFAPETNLVGGLYRQTQRAAVLQQAEPETLLAAEDAAAIDTPPATQEDSHPLQAAVPQTAGGWYVRELLDNLWILWLGVAVVLLARKITSYHSFVRYIKAGRQLEDNPDVLDTYHQACEDMGISTPLPLYRNSLAVSPMHVGILRPFLILPELDMGEEELRLVFQHELVHHKRRDILYKWLVQIAVCLHWFNPLVYLISRETGKCCELSCDEAVLGRMGQEHQRRYGDTLLASMKTGGGYGDTVASVTLSEDGKLLKERLGAILQFRPGTKTMAALSGALALVLLCGAAFTGAYTGARRSPAVVPAANSPAEIFIENTEVAQATGQINNWPQYLQWNNNNLTEESMEMAFQVDEPVTVRLKSATYSGQFAFTLLDPEGETLFSSSGSPGSSHTVELESPGTYAARLSAENHTGSVRLTNLDESEFWDVSPSFTSNDGWSYNNFGYQDGYVAEVGWRSGGDLEDYALSFALDVDGTLYSIAFTEQASPYAGDDTLLAVVRAIISPMIKNHTAQVWTDSFFVVRQVMEEPDPEALLRRMYEEQNLAVFSAALPQCSQETILELVYEAQQDHLLTFFSLLCDCLPADFDGEELARKAARDGQITFLGVLSPFLSETLQSELMLEALGIDIPSINPPDLPELPKTAGSSQVLKIANASGQSSVNSSSSFSADEGQTLTLRAVSDIQGGTVDFFLFSPDGKEQRHTFGGGADSKTITLSSGVWAYNCTGFFESGSFELTGTLD